MARARKPPRSGRSAESGGTSRETLTLEREAVRYWRLQRGLTQEALAQQRAALDGESQGISYAQIRRIEQDGRCGPGTARILAALLGVEIAQLAPRDPRHLPCGLPREPSTDFVGRERELKGVLSALQGRGSVRIAASIEGLPGIGKTELALQVCGLCERERRFRVFWFDAEQPDLTPTWADVIAPHLGVDGATPAERCSAALRAVESLAEPVLLVLDNVQEWSASRPWPRPRGRHVHWLVTTRRGDLGGREFQHIDVPVLSAEAAEQLMIQIAGPEIATRPGFRPLLELLGGYTIAVELAATFLRRFPEVDPEAYRADLERGRGAELEEEVEGRSLYGQTLERALELLWQRLPKRVSAHWQLAAQFAQAPATPALSDACGLDRRARAELRDFHLIETHSGRGWSMHRLVRAFGRRAGDASEREEANRAFFHGCADLAGDERSPGMDINAGFRIYVPDRDHFDAALRQTRSYRGTGDAWHLCNGVGCALSSMGDQTEAVSVLESALEIGAGSSDARPVRLAATRRHIGGALVRARHLERADALLRHGFEEAREQLGDTHELTMGLAAGHSYVLRELGDYEGARQGLERILELSEQRFGKDNPDVLTRKVNLGVALRLQGELSRARDLLESALESRVRVSGDDHPLSVVARTNLGLVMDSLGDHGRTKELLERSLDLALRVHGNEHPTTWSALAGLASALLETGEIARARELLEEAAPEESTLTLWGSPMTRLLGKALHAQGDFERARAALERALEVREKKCGPLHFYTYDTRLDLGELLLELGELERARELCAGAVDITEANHGDAHFAVIRSRQCLSEVLRELGDLERARALSERALAGAELKLDEGMGRRARVRAALGRVLHDLGEQVRARACFETALEELVSTSDETHPAVSSIRSDLARVLRDLGELPRSQALLESAVEADQKSQRAEYPDSALPRARLADLFRRQGDAHAARLHASEALRLARRQPPKWIHRAEIETLCTALPSGVASPSRSN